MLSYAQFENNPQYILLSIIQWGDLANGQCIQWSGIATTSFAPHLPSLLALAMPTCSTPTSLWLISSFLASATLVCYLSPGCSAVCSFFRGINLTCIPFLWYTCWLALFSWVLISTQSMQVAFHVWWFISDMGGFLICITVVIREAGTVVGKKQLCWIWNDWVSRGLLCTPVLTTVKITFLATVVRIHVISEGKPSLTSSMLSSMRPCTFMLSSKHLSKSAFMSSASESSTAEVSMLTALHTHAPLNNAWLNHFIVSWKSLCQPQGSANSFTRPLIRNFCQWWNLFSGLMQCSGGTSILQI